MQSIPLGQPVSCFGFPDLEGHVQDPKETYPRSFSSDDERALSKWSKEECD